MKHYSRRTEQAYVYWIKRFIFFHGKRHPATMGEAEVTAFLNHFAGQPMGLSDGEGGGLLALINPIPTPALPLKGREIEPPATVV